jgi:hypothetical protein
MNGAGECMSLRTAENCETLLFIYLFILGIYEGLI